MVKPIDIINLLFELDQSTSGLLTLLNTIATEYSYSSVTLLGFNTQHDALCLRLHSCRSNIKSLLDEDLVKMINIAHQELNMVSSSMQADSYHKPININNVIWGNLHYQYKSNYYFVIETEQISTSDKVQTEFISIAPYIRSYFVSILKLESNNLSFYRTQSIVKSIRVPVIIVDGSGKTVAINKPMLELIDSESRINEQKNTTNLAISNLEKDENVLQTKTLSKINNKHAIPVYTLKVYDNEYNNSTSDAGSISYCTTINYSKPFTSKHLNNLFNLTAAESEVCIAIYSGMTPIHIADKLNKSINTIRKQLKSCFKKTGCNSQINLVNLLSGIPIKLN